MLDLTFVCTVDWELRNIRIPVYFIMHHGCEEKMFICLTHLHIFKSPSEISFKVIDGWLYLHCHGHAAFAFQKCLLTYNGFYGLTSAYSLAQCFQNWVPRCLWVPHENYRGSARIFLIFEFRVLKIRLLLKIGFSFNIGQWLILLSNIFVKLGFGW